MNKTLKAAATALAIASFVPMAAFAQTAVGTSMTAVGSAAQMPVFYSSNGSAVNNGNSTALPAGYYYLAPGSQHQIYYYGNGTYYDPSIGQYGGSVTNPNGTAGVNLGYSTNTATVSSGSYTTPGVPNTGMGGEALATWLTLAVAALAAITGVTYIATSKKSA